MAQNKTFKSVVLRIRPVSGEQLDIKKHYEVVDSPFRELKDGEFLAKIQYLSCDPTIRIWASDKDQYMPPSPIGQPMRALGLGQVVESKNPNFNVGDTVSGLVGWNEYFYGTAASGLSVIPKGVPVEAALGPCGLTGLTAYFGLTDIGKPKPGDKVLVSGAAGATGSIVAQIAKISGCHVTGIAGGKEKCDWLKNELHLDEVIDYKSENVTQRVKEIGGVDPIKNTGGFDIYFDNVGGEALEAAAQNIALGGRIVLCGAISSYNSSEPPVFHSYTMLLMRRASLTGFVITDYMSKAEIAINRIGKWIAQGKIKFKTDVQEGPLDQCVDVFNRLFESKNDGKQVHKLV